MGGPALCVDAGVCKGLGLHVWSVSSAAPAEKALSVIDHEKHSLCVFWQPFKGLSILQNVFWKLHFGLELQLAWKVPVEREGIFLFIQRQAVYY